MAVIGIDLGTTNSLAVAFADDRYVMIPNSFKEYLTPSVVSVDDDGSVIVGKIAKQRLVTHPDDTTSLFKRNMGTKDTVILKKKKYLPEELSAFVVRQLMEDAQRFLGEEIEEVVISVPAYFNEHQRSATKRIGRLLNVKIERLVNEPSAAAIACHQGNDEDEAFIVFDFGGGTLDVSVVDCFDNVVSICAIAGDNHLGGSDFDRLIAQDFCKQNGIDFDALTIKRQESLLMQSELAKMRLQNQNDTDIMFHMDEKDYTYHLSNDRLKAISVPLFNRMKHIIAEAVNSSGFEKGEIDKLILVGGSCHMPIVTDFLKELMNISVHEEEDMDQIVVMGLGTYIGIKQRKEAVRQLVLTDICPFSLGTSVYNHDNPAKPLSHVQIPRNTVLPASKSASYYIVKKGSKNMVIEVYQGEGVYAQDNDKLAEYNVRIPVNFEESEGVEVTFSYDINALLCIDTKVLSTGERQRFFLHDNDASNDHVEAIKQASSKLNQADDLHFIHEQIQRMLMESSTERQEYIKEVYLKFEALIKRYESNIRKRIQLISRMKDNLKELEAFGSNCDFFNMDDEDDDGSGGYLS